MGERMSRRGRGWMPHALDTMQHPAEHALAMLFLHELDSDACPVKAPPGAVWSQLVEVSDSELGAALDRACAVCLEACPDHLDGFFDRCSFADEQPDRLRRAMTQIAGMTRSESVKLNRRAFLGDFYSAGRSLSAQQWQGAFFTPENVAAMMAEILAPNPGDFVLDPAAGGGVLLCKTLDNVRERFGDEVAASLTLIGVELDQRTAQVARAALLLAGADPAQFIVFCGNSLAQPVVGRDRADGALKTIEAQCCIANPPFGGKVSMRELELAAENGPLIVPDHILYRAIVVPSADEPKPLLGTRPSQHAVPAALLQAA
jgi:type I restriction-modification system DNA methylase subunit